MRNPLLPYILLIAVFATVSTTSAQQVSNLRTQTFAVLADTLQLDSLSIIPGSFIAEAGDSLLSPNEHFILDEPAAQLIWLQRPQTDSITVSYRVFPLNFTASTYRKDPELLRPRDTVYLLNPFMYTPEELRQNPFDYRGLDYNGSFARGISFGNNQDVSVHSNFNLQLSGMITDDVEVLAALSDNNIPIQPEGTTRQLNEFDRVFIQLRKDQHRVILGDYEIESNQTYFMRYLKKLQGIRYEGPVYQQNERKVTADVSAALAKGKFTRNTLRAIDGNQGPYKLTGPNGEVFIIVLAGTERVYIDGQLQQRGADQDYVIDYNQGEILFMPHRIITKDLRIVVEFEYSDRNYFRSLVQGGALYEQGRLKLKMNVFSEQDNKNQAVDQEIDDETRALLREIGDDIDQAFLPGIDTVEFTLDRVLYRAIDTVVEGVPSTIFQYSTNPDSAFYAISFSFLSDGGGSYEPGGTTSNGRFYTWVGTGKGTYEPVRILRTPQKQQMATIGAEYQLTKSTLVDAEIAVSNNDVNTFSTKDNADDSGLAAKTTASHAFRLGDENTVKDIKIHGGYEFVQQRFRALERFRPAEFTRDWNLNAADTAADEHLATAGITFRHGEKGIAGYELQTFNRTGGFYSGINHLFHANYDFGTTRVRTRSSYLQSDSKTTSTRFLRPNAEVSQALPFLGGWRVGAGAEQENNRIQLIDSDTITSTSFLFYQYKFFITTPDTAENRLYIEYLRRNDFTPDGEGFKQSSKGDIYTFSGDILNIRPHQLRWNLTYRELFRMDSLVNEESFERHYLGRVEYGVQMLKQVVRADFLYELGSGQEQKRDFIYVEEPQGKGVFIYLGDLNGNNVKDPGEFEIAPQGFEDEAKYIRLAVPTNEYVPVNMVQFNHVLSINPRSVWYNMDDFRDVLSRFSTQTSLQIGRKTIATEGPSPFNPFVFDIADTVMVSINSLVRNTIFFNRSESKFGSDYTWQDNRNKFVVTNGFEARIFRQHQLKTRYLVRKGYNVQLDLVRGDRIHAAQYGTDKDYHVRILQAEPSLTLMPGSSFRFIFSYQYAFKENLSGETKEFAVNHSGSTEMRYNILTTSSLQAKFNYVAVGYNGQQNTAVAYAILQGLQPGNNYLWTLSYDRKISDMIQMSLIYDGRKTGTANMVHLGRAQMTALF